MFLFELPSCSCGMEVVEASAVTEPEIEHLCLQIRTKEGRLVSLKVDTEESDKRRWEDAIRRAAAAYTKDAGRRASTGEGKLFRIFVEKECRNYILRAASEKERDEWLARIGVRLLIP